MAGDASGVRAGNAYVSVGADLNPLDAALKKLESKFSAFGGKISGIGSKFSNVGKSATAIGASIAGVGIAGAAGLIALTKRFADVGSAVADASARTGASASSLSAIGYAAEQTGSDLSTVTGAIGKMQKGIVAGSDDIASLGIDMESLRNKSPEQQFEEIGKRIALIDDPAERAAKAMAVFGKSGTALLPLFDQFDELTDEAKKLGIALSDTDADNADRLGDAFDRVQKTIGGIGTRIGAALARPLADILERVAAIGAKAIDWARNNEGTIRSVALITAGVIGIGAAIATVGAGIIGVGAVLSGIGAIVTGIGAAFGAVGAVVGAVLTPIGLVVGAVVGLGAYIGYVALEATGGLTKLGDMFGSLGGTATTAWSGIVAALSTGDLQTAGEIAFTALEIGWLKVTDTMQSVWAGVVGFFQNVWLNAINTIIGIGANIYFGTAKYFDLLSTALTTAFDTAFVYITGAIDAIQISIAKAIIKAQEFFGLFSKDQSTQIQRSLDDELAGRAKKRGGELTQRTLDRATGLQQRDTERRKTAQDFSKTVAEDIDRRRPKAPGENKGLTAAQQRLADLQAKLDSKASEAAANAQEASVTRPTEDRVALGQAAGVSAIQFTSAESVGSFSGRAAAAQGFVSVTVQEEQRNLLQSIAATNEQQLAIAQRQDEREAD